MYGLIFDMDGVLADSEGICVQATTAMFRELYAFEPVPEDYLPFVGMGAVRYTEGPAEKYGVAIDTPKAVRRRTENMIRMMEHWDESIAFSGVHTLLDAAFGREDWKVAIATSTPQDLAEATLKAARIPMERVAAFVHGDMVVHKKPHPEVFSKAAQALGLPPGQCVGVEDSPPGVEALNAAGIASVAVTHTFSREQLAHARLIVDSLEQLNLTLLAELLG